MVEAVSGPSNGTVLVERVGEGLDPVEALVGAGSALVVGFGRGTEAVVAEGGRGGWLPVAIFPYPTRRYMWVLLPLLQLLLLDSPFSWVDGVADTALGSCEREGTTDEASKVFFLSSASGKEVGTCTFPGGCFPAPGAFRKVPW